MVIGLLGPPCFLKRLCTCHPACLERKDTETGWQYCLVVTSMGSEGTQTGDRIPAVPLSVYMTLEASQGLICKMVTITGICFIRPLTRCMENTGISVSLGACCMPPCAKYCQLY